MSRADCIKKIEDQQLLSTIKKHHWNAGLTARASVIDQIADASGMNARDGCISQHMME